MSQSTILPLETARPKVGVAPPQSSPVPAPQAKPLWNWFKRSVSTLVVLCMLGTVALWGHATGWTIPRFSTLVGDDAVLVDNWCSDHNVPESQCIGCHPDLIKSAPDYGWCKEHGIAQCPLEHPDVAQLNVRPVISDEDVSRAARALALRTRSENNSRCKLHDKRIQFASIDALNRAGVDIALVQQRPILEAVTANGEIVFDETHSAHLGSRVSGIVWRVEKQVGQLVKKGEILALIDASEVGEAKAQFLEAIARLRLANINSTRLKPLARDGVVAGRQFREAETVLQESQIRLLKSQQKLENLGFSVDAGEFVDLSTDEIAQRIQFLGISTSSTNEFGSDLHTSNLFPLRAPLDGVVVECNIVPGETVDATSTCFAIADVRQMWLTLNVRQDEAKYLTLGQTVLFRPSNSQQEPEIKGTLAWISSAADDQTRTVKVRANLPNADGRLRANTFGTGRIVLREESHASVVPNEAVHWDGCCHVVFVRDQDFFKEGAPKYFHIRKVRVGVSEGGNTEIIAGLLPGEVVASRNSVVLEAQLLKSNLGAGCCEADSGKK